MLKQKLNKKMDYKFSEYFKLCDNVNKYNLTSSSDTPFIKQIVLELSLENTLNAFVSKTQYTAENGQILTLLFIYITSNLFPYINYNKSNSLKLINKTGYSLKIKFTNSQNIFFFLHDIYKKIDLSIHNNFNDVKNQKYFVITKLCNVDIFFELKNIIDKQLNNINSKELFFNLKFIIFKPSKIKFNNNFMQNFPFLNK